MPEPAASSSALYETNFPVRETRCAVGAQRGWRLWIKILFDRSVAAIALLLFAPLLAGLALLVRFTMGEPVLFRQRRPGRFARLFTAYKFSTMTQARDPDGNLLPDADRLTPLGRILRRTSLDELPQLWNVLRGDMSLVGPRPLLPQYLPRYSAHQLRRHNVLPGITGLSQVNGRNNLTWEQRFDLDVWYVDHWSLWLDLRILFLTCFAVLRREGIAQPGQATMAEFMGSEKN